MRRGDLVTVAGRGDYAGKPRPAVVIQSDDFAETDSVTVCPLTHVEADAPLLRLRLEPDGENNLRAISWIMIDKVATFRRANVGAVFGCISDADVVRINRSLPVFLGLAG
ncbi:type II toxin-antitoxin system PemK/MazF family toxin [Azospirillum sp. sgz301742]